MSQDSSCTSPVKLFLRAPAAEAANLNKEGRKAEICCFLTFSFPCPNDHSEQQLLTTDVVASQFQPEHISPKLRFVPSASGG